MLQQQTIEFRTSFTRTPIAVNLTVGQEYVAGSGDDNEIILQGQDILTQHAKLTLSSNGLCITPIEQSLISVNGSPIRDSASLTDGDWLSMGSCLFQINFPGQARAIATSASQPSRRQSQSEILTIGRLPECDVEIASPLVSREHARLYCGSGKVEIEDLHSTNGTFVNGRRLNGRVRLQQGDRVAIASFAFIFTGEALEPIDTSGRVRVEARGLYKEIVDRSTRQTRRLLDDISLVIEPGEFVVIFGTSGSGKSTLLDALNGRRPSTGGQVLYNGTGLYTSFDAFRAAIGYVPQQDIVHRKISVRHALEYTAHLRLPPDTSREEINAYITKVLDKVELAEKAESPIDTPAPLSGGQLKRVSLAVELVANPNILFLDEVTSGLDAGTDKRMMRLFANLAADRKTVICVTHTLENIDVCHQVILLHKGKLVYFGPPKQAAGHFGVERLSDVYELLESSPASLWEQKFRQSAFYRTYIVDRLSSHDPDNGTTRKLTELNTVNNRNRWFDWRQTGTLMRRYIDLIVSDQKNLLILLLQAPLIAIVIGLVFDTNGLPAQRAAAESQIFFILVLSSIWFGTLNSARELVKELPIYMRERSVNLRIMPYLISKLLPLAVLCLIQCAFLMGIVSLLVELPGSYPSRVVALFTAGMAATCMGLAVSAFVDSNDKAVAMAPILLIPQVVLSNAVVRLGDVGLSVAKSSMISFWALDAMKTTLSSESRLALELASQPVLGTYGTNLAMVTVKLIEQQLSQTRPKLAIKAEKASSVGVADSGKCIKIPYKWSQGCKLLKQLRSEEYFKVSYDSVSDDLLLEHIKNNRSSIIAELAKIDFGRDLQRYLKKRQDTLPKEAVYLNALESLVDVPKPLEYLKHLVEISIELNNVLASSVLSQSFETLNTIIVGIQVYRNAVDIFTRKREMLETYIWDRCGGTTSGVCKEGNSKDSVWLGIKETYSTYVERISEDTHIPIKPVDQLGNWFENAFSAYRLVAFDDANSIRYVEGEAITRSATALYTQQQGTRGKEYLTTNSKLELDGIGPIQVGMTVSEASKAIELEMVDNNSNSYSCYYVRQKNGPLGIDFMVIEGRIVRIDIHSTEVATIAGARIGSTEAEILKIDPSSIEVTPSKYDDKGHYLIFRAQNAKYSNYRLIFETDGARVTTFRAGKIPEVEWVEDCF